MVFKPVLFIFVEKWNFPLKVELSGDFHRNIVFKDGLGKIVTPSYPWPGEL